MIRRAIVIATLLAALGAFAAPVSARAPRGGQVRHVTRMVSQRVTSSGPYLVVVSLRAQLHDERVTVYLSGAAKRTVRASADRATLLHYALTLTQAPSELVARAVSPMPGVRLAMTVTSKDTGSSGASPASPQPTPSPSTTSTSSSGSGSGSSGGGSSGNQYPNPYTNLVWSDNFAGPAGSPPSSSNWSIAGGQGQCGNSINTNTSSSSNVALTGNDQLAITAQHSGNSYTAAEIVTNPITLFPYGAIEASIKVPPGQGLCPAFWLEGDSTSANPCSWPGCGEIDVLEAPAFDAEPVDAYFDLHSPWTTTDPNDNYQSFNSYTAALGDLSTSFHTYAIIWSPGSIVWTIDGVEFAQATPASLVPQAQWVFDAKRPYQMILDLAVGGWPCNGIPSGCPGASFPAQMLVNWVRVYQ